MIRAKNTLENIYTYKKKSKQKNVETNLIVSSSFLLELFYVGVLFVRQK